MQLAEKFEDDVDLSERVDAFITGFSCLKDTLGDKFLPLLLSALREKPLAQIDNLDKAEKVWLDNISR